MTDIGNLRLYNMADTSELLWLPSRFRLGGLRLVGVILLMAVVTGCADGQPRDQAPPEITPRHDTLPANHNQGGAIVFREHHRPLGTDTGGEYLAGRLALREGCLRVEVGSNNTANPGVSWWLIWPSGFNFQTHLGTVQVVDGQGRIVARVGDHIRLSRTAFGSGLRKGLSEDCAVPYFLVGDEVTAFDPGSEATEIRLSDPEVLFLREKTVIARDRVSLTAAGVGELVLDGKCLRLKNSPTESHWPTIIWPAGFTPHVHHGVVQIRNGVGRVMAEVGDEIAGGGGYFDLSSGECSGPVWRANKIKTLPDVEVYFAKQDGTLATEQGTEVFVGTLVLNGKCLQVADDAIRVRDRSYVGASPLIIWPHAFVLSVSDGVVGIVDGTSGVIARVGDEVEFNAFNLTYGEAKEHGGLAEITPACSGPYWAVGTKFAVVPAP